MLSILIHPIILLDFIPADLAKRTKWFKVQETLFHWPHEILYRSLSGATVKLYKATPSSCQYGGGNGPILTVHYDPCREVRKQLPLCISSQLWSLMSLKALVTDTYVACCCPLFQHSKPCCLLWIYQRRVWGLVLSCCPVGEPQVFAMQRWPQWCCTQTRPPSLPLFLNSIQFIYIEPIPLKVWGDAKEINCGVGWE